MQIVRVEPLVGTYETITPHADGSEVIAAIKRRPAALKVSSFSLAASTQRAADIPGPGSGCKALFPDADGRAVNASSRTRYLVTP